VSPLVWHPGANFLRNVAITTGVAFVRSHSLRGLSAIHQHLMAECGSSRDSFPGQGWFKAVVVGLVPVSLDVC
jgi:hypothetical protein